MTADAHAPDHQPKAKIFISYSRKDMAFADRLEAALKARGFNPLIDRQDPVSLQDWSKGIAPFEDWWKRIETLISKADTIVFVLSPDAVASNVALKEIDFAASLNKRFAPIVCRRVEDAIIPEALRRLNFIFFDEASRFDSNADHLAAILNVDIDWIRKHSEYGEAARRWAAVGRPGPQGLLLRSPVLEEAERWISSRPSNAPSPTAETLAFVAESRHAAIRQRRRLMALTCVVVLVIATGLLAWWQEVFLRQQIYVFVNVHSLKTIQEQALKRADSFKECADCPEMVVVPAGTSIMGSRESLMVEDEHPQHPVTIREPFAVAKFELTFAEWDACEAQGGCPHDSDLFGRGPQPVISVSWDEAKQYVAWISKITGKTYRLLTEGEYEYAARAGTTTAYPWGDDIMLNGMAMANCDGCGSQWDHKGTAPVGSFPPNKFGLYDMVGNVWVWVEDCYHGNYHNAPTDGSTWIIDDHNCRVRVVRGGSWSDNEWPHGIRSASRWSLTTDSRWSWVGFRVGRTLLPP